MSRKAKAKAAKPLTEKRLDELNQDRRMLISLVEEHGGLSEADALRRLFDLIQRMGAALANADFSEEGANDFTEEESAAAADAELEAAAVLKQAAALGWVEQIR